MKQDFEARLQRLKIAYLAAAAALMALAVVTPLIVTRDVALTESVIIAEDVVEMLAIALLMGLAAASSRLYQQKLKRLSLKMQALDRLRERLEDSLADAFDYIGAVNVEIGEIRSILGRIRRYPQTKKEFQALLNEYTLRAMVIAGSPWALVRIIDTHRHRTLKEAVQKRPGVRLPTAVIGNRALVDGQKIEGVFTAGTGANNLPIRTFVVFPVDSLRAQEQILVSAIAGEIEMLFLIFTSGCVSRLRPSALPGALETMALRT
jgi:hypothetical protein